MALSLEGIVRASNLEVGRIQAAGVPPALIDKAAALFEIPKTRLMKALGMPVTTIAAKARRHQNLNRDETESLTRVVRLYGHARTLMPNPSAWFLDPSPSLGGQPPLDAAGTEGGGRAVENLLTQIEYGTAA